MKPNFALSLSFDGLRLMQRADSGWLLVGDVALDEPDLTAALARLRDKALALDPAGLTTKLLIPNDQIRYLALDTTRAAEDEVRDALADATPYALDDLRYDFVKGGGRTYVAAVARETLQEAEGFAREHGFNPVSFAAVPEPFTFVGEPFFGPIGDADVSRDEAALVITGMASAATAASAATHSDAAPAVDAPPEGADAALSEPAMDDNEPKLDATNLVTAEQTQDTAEAPEAELQDRETHADTNGDLAQEDTAEAVAFSDTDSAAATHSDAIAPDTSSASVEPDTAPQTQPVFASLRADRSEGAPMPQAAPGGRAGSARDGGTRAEPTFSHRAPADPHGNIAVPQAHSDDPMPPVAAPSRNDTAAPVPSAPSAASDEPPQGAAPAITGDAPDTVPAHASVAAASLQVAPEPPAPDDSPAAGSGGFFASRRKRNTGNTDADTTPPQKASPRATVFGARAPKEQPVIGGKPRFLGLILTAVLLLFLLAAAAFAALASDTVARWFGFGGAETTQVAATTGAETAPAPVAQATDPPDASPEGEGTPDLAASDALAAPTAPSGGQVLSPAEAQRIYAATGVWQRAPRIPLTPRIQTLDGFQVATAPRAVMRVPSSPMQSSDSLTGDAVIPTPVDPPPASARFAFGPDGRILATPEGAITPDGILVIAGRPPLSPPTRPGTVAPVVTPQDQLANVMPDAANVVADAPEGVVVIAGRPNLTPPVRPGTGITDTTVAAPSAATPDFSDAPEGVVLIAGPPPVRPPLRPAATNAAPTVTSEVAGAVTPLVQQDGLQVFAGAPPVLPPMRPGTQAPLTTPMVPADSATANLPASNTTDEGLNVIAGSPPVLPPVRPGTTAPAQTAPRDDAALTDLSRDVAQALTTGTAQRPDANTRRPQTRPASIAAAAEAAAAAQEAANTPILGQMTQAQAAAFRPRTRPAGLAPAPTPEPTPEPEQQTGLQLSSEIAAAVQASNNRFVNPTANAVRTSLRPDTRPRNMARIVARAEAAQQRAAAQQAAAQQAAAARAVTPSGPTAGSVAQAATLDNAINLREVNLIGIYGGSSDRRALVRLSNGRLVRVTVGDRLDGGRVTAISADALSYNRRGRAVTLRVPG